MYNIFQIKISNEVSDYVNSNDRGHSGAAEKYPEYNANMEVTMRGSEGYTADMFEHYTKVCEVANFESESNKLEEVFKILNGSVGDIIEDTSTGKFHIVDGMGFKEVETNTLETA